MTERRRVRGAGVLARTVSAMWAATVLAIAVGLAGSGDYRWATVAFALAGYFALAALRSGIWVSGDVLILRFPLHTRVVPIRDVERVTVEAYDGATNWGHPSRFLSMIVLVTVSDRVRCYFTVSARRRCRRLAERLKSELGLSKSPP